MTFRLDLRGKQTRAGLFVLTDGFPYVCGWCGQRYYTARELVAHVCAERQAAA